MAQAGGYDVPAAPSWYGEVLDALQSHARETGEPGDALTIVEQLSQAWRDSDAAPAGTVAAPGIRWRSMEGHG